MHCSAMQCTQLPIHGVTSVQLTFAVGHEYCSLVSSYRLPAGGFHTLKGDP